LSVSAADSDDAPLAPATPGALEPPSPYRWVIVAQLWLHQVVMQGMPTAIAVLLVRLQADLHFGTIEAGWLGSARTAGQLLVFPASMFIVRFAPTRLYGALVVAVGLATLAAGWAPSFWLLFAAQIAFSVGFSLAQVPASLLRSRWIPPQELATVWGIGNAMTAVGQSALLFGIPLVAAFLGGWRGVMQVTALVSLAAGALWAVTARERPLAVAPGPRPRAFEALKRREFYILGLITVGGATAYTASILFLPTYLVRERGLTLPVAGSVTAALPLAGLLANLTSGLLSDRVGRRKVFIWPVGLALPPLYFLAFSAIPIPALVVVVFLVGYCAWLPFPVLTAIPFELPGVRPAEVAVGQALVQALTGLGILVGPLLVGQVAVMTGSLRGGLLSLVALPVLFAIGCLWLPETGRRRA
jgi:predicted MFS family arabinose efflux permease